VLIVNNFSIASGQVTLSLEQKWFLSSGESPPEEKTWSIPLFIGTLKEQARETIMMKGKTQEVTLQVSAETDAEFVIINKGVSAPLRVAYTADMRSRLASGIKAGLISASDRAGLVMDSYALAKAGILGADELISFIVAYKGEVDYVVWDALSQVLLGFQKLLMGGAPEDVFKRYMAVAANLVQTSWDKSALGWVASASDGHTSGLLRGLLMKLLAKFAPDAAFVSEAQRRYAIYIEDPQGKASELPDEYRVPVFQVVLEHGTGKEYAQMRELFKKLTTNIDQKHVFMAAGYVSEIALKEEVLQWSISGEIKIQDFFYLMGSVSASSRAGLDLTWGFFRKEFEAIRAMVKDGNPSLMDAAIQMSTSGYCSSEKASEVEKFFEEHPLPGSKRKISQILEEIRANASFVTRILSTSLVKSEFWDSLDKELGIPAIKSNL